MQHFLYKHTESECQQVASLGTKWQRQLQWCTSLEKVIKWLSIFFFRYKDAQEQRFNRIAGYVKLAEYTKTRAFLFEF